jgi:2-(1,2-epoxy-1,2-dihydrophenyl)acetyl-CoA isomerase
VIDAGQWTQNGCVRLEVDDGLVRLSLCRPEVHNAVSAGLGRSLRHALAWPGLEEADALVLSGSGGAFCSGGDVGVMRSAIEGGDPESVLRPILDDLHASVSRLRALPMPVVAAVQGEAVSAGMGLALAADMRVMGRSAVMITKHVAMGGAPDAGLSYFLARELGRGRALAAMMLSERLTADDLLACGLVQQVVPDDEVIGAATRLARRLALIPRESLLAARRLVDAATLHDLDRHLDLEKQEFLKLCTGDNLREGVAAFLEDRPPVFNRPHRRTGPGSDF